MHFYYSKFVKLYPHIGVYSITNMVNGRQYVGMSMCIPGRIEEHFKALFRMNHPSSRMNEDHSHYGAHVFRVEVLALCDSTKLRQVEDKFIKELNPYYNPGSRRRLLNK